MSEQVVAPPPEDELVPIPQPEVTSLPESERAIWEREAVRELFADVNVPELTGDPQEDSSSTDGLYRATIGMLYPRRSKRSKERYEHLPQVTTPEGMEEVLSQIIQMTEQYPELLSTSTVANCAHTLSAMFDRLPPESTEANPELSLRFLSSMIALADEQESRNPRLRSGQHRQFIYQALTKQFLAELAFEDPEDPEGVLTTQIHKAWQDPEFLRIISGIWVGAIERFDYGEAQEWESEGYSELEKVLMNKTLRSLGFTDEDQELLKAAWGSVHSFDEHGVYEKTKVHRRPGYVKKQVDAMFELVRADFDAPKKLFRQFGIRHFGRYNARELIQQLERGDHEGDVEVLITAADDWNTAYKDRYKRTKRDLKFSHPVYYEASNLAELTRYVVRASKRYGPINKLLISGHGNPDGFVLGERDEVLAGRVARDDVKRSKGAKNLAERGILSPECEILISSCSVGKPGGVAEAISEATGLRVVAPDDIASGLYFDEKEGDYNANYLNRKRKNNDAIVFEPSPES